MVCRCFEFVCFFKYKIHGADASDGFLGAFVTSWGSLGRLENCSDAAATLELAHLGTPCHFPIDAAASPKNKAPARPWGTLPPLDCIRTYLQIRINNTKSLIHVRKYKVWRPPAAAQNMGRRPASAASFLLMRGCMACATHLLSNGRNSLE